MIVASEHSLRLHYEAFERWLAERESERIERGLSLTEDGEKIETTSTDGREIRRLLAQIGTAGSSHETPDKDVLDARMSDFGEARSEFGRGDSSHVLGHTLVRSYLREYTSGGPRQFLQGLESRAGLLYPHFQGRGVKRVRPSTPVLDMLVRACVPAGHAVALDDFLERLWNRFGLIVGGRRGDGWDDVEVLNTRNIGIDASALTENTETVVAQLEGMGLARRYADNVTFVGDGHVA